MADNKKKTSTFFSTKQSTNNSSTSDITNQIKQALDMSVLSLLTSMSQDLNAIMKKVTGGKSSTEKEKSEKPKESSEEKDKKEVTKEEIKQLKKDNKKKEKQQVKINKKLDKQEQKEKAKKDKKDQDSPFDKIFKNIKSSLKDSIPSTENFTKNASKILSGSSMTVDTALRELQIGMGLSSNQAMALKGSMEKMGIDQSDLAFLTKGQRDLLSELTGTMEKAYAGTDMSAISEMGNSLFKIQSLFSMFKDILLIKLQEAMTVLQPVLDMVEVLLTQIMDSVIAIFESPDFKALLELITQVVGSIVSMLLPLLSGLLNQVVSIIMEMLVNLLPLVTMLMPSLMMLVEGIMSIVIPLMPIITEIIGFVMQILMILIPIILSVLPLVSMILQLIGDILMWVFPIILPILETMGSIIQKIIPVIYKVISFIYNIIIDIYNAINFWGKDKSKMSTELNLNTYSSFNMPDMQTTLDIPTYGDPVSQSYAGSNNVSSVTNETKNIKVDASFSSNISGDASNYSKELSKTNYSSSVLLASIIEEGA